MRTKTFLRKTLSVMANLSVCPSVCHTLVFIDKNAHLEAHTNLASKTAYRQQIPKCVKSISVEFD